MGSILIVDDDIELCEMLTEYLGTEGFTVEVAHDGEAGTQRALSHEYDVTLASRKAICRGKVLELTSAEYNVLEVLVRNAGHVVNKEILSEQALGRKLERYDRSIDMHVSKLRRKLGPGPENQSVIQTVRNIGYQFAGA